MTAFWPKNKRIRPFYKITALFISLSVVFQLTSGCFSFRMSQKEVNTYFADSKLKPTISAYNIAGRTINYSAIGNDTLPTIIFFHGAPGSWSAFIDFFQNDSLLNKVEMVSVDRPGYGYSNFGNSQPSLQKQTEYFKPLLEKYHKTPTYLVGHSLGGPIIAKIAMEYPDLIDGLIMVAPSIDPDLEPNEGWFRFPLHTPFLRWILPVSFRVTNDEIYFLEDELNLMLPDWKKITVPVTVIQGMKDSLVPPGNAEFAKNRLVNSEWLNIVLVEDMDHFVPWTNPDLIENAIYYHLQKKVEQNPTFSTY